MRISDFDFEDSNRFLVTASGVNTLPITIQNGRWAAGGLNADTKVIMYQQAGPLVISGMRVDGGAPPSPTFDIVASRSTLPMIATAIGNSIG